MFWKSTYNEFIKIAAKPRSYIGVGAITLIVGIILFAMKVDGMDFISFVTQPFEQSLSFEGNILNGNLIAFIILQMLIIHVPLLIALVTGDLVSGEGAMGTIRLLLTKPISRTKILFSKYIAGAAYTFIILLWLCFMALIVGKWLFGTGDLLVLNSDGLIVLQEHDLAWRFAAGFSVAFLSLMTIATLSASPTQYSARSVRPRRRAMAPARERPAQHMATEWVWMRARPRYSQIPASGHSAKLAHLCASFSISRNSGSPPG